MNSWKEMLLQILGKALHLMLRMSITTCRYNKIPWQQDHDDFLQRKPYGPVDSFESFQYDNLN